MPYRDTLRHQAVTQGHMRHGTQISFFASPYQVRAGKETDLNDIWTIHNKEHNYLSCAVFQHNFVDSNNDDEYTNTMPGHTIVQK